MGKTAVIKQIEKNLTKDTQQAVDVIADVQKKAGKTVQIDNLPQAGVAKAASTQKAKIKAERAEHLKPLTAAINGVSGVHHKVMKMDSCVANAIEGSNSKRLKRFITTKKHGEPGQVRTTTLGKLAGAQVLGVGGYAAIGGIGSAISNEGIMPGALENAAQIIGDEAGVVGKVLFGGNFGETSEIESQVSTKETGKSLTGYGWIDTLINNCNGLTAAGTVAAIGGVASNQSWLTAIGVTMAVGSWIMNYTGAFESDDDTSGGSDSGEDEKEVPETVSEASEATNEAEVATGNSFAATEEAKEESSASTDEQAEKDFAKEGAAAADHLKDMGDEVDYGEVEATSDESAAEKQAQYNNYEPEL